MKVFALALALLFIGAPLEAAKKVKTHRSVSAKRYKAKKHVRANKSRKAAKIKHQSQIN
jgi:hypothetical protein